MSETFSTSTFVGTENDPLMDVDDSGLLTTAVSGPIGGGAEPAQARKQFEGDAVNQTDDIAGTCSGSDIGTQVKSPVPLVTVLPHSDLPSSISPQVEPLGVLYCRTHSYCPCSACTSYGICDTHEHDRW